MSDLGMRFWDNLNVLREAMGVVQHHDAITGTATQAVTDHYSEMLSDGIKYCASAVDQALR